MIGHMKDDRKNEKNVNFDKSCFEDIGRARQPILLRLVPELVYPRYIYIYISKQKNVIFSITLLLSFVRLWPESQTVW